MGSCMGGGEGWKCAMNVHSLQAGSKHAPGKGGVGGTCSLESKFEEVIMAKALIGEMFGSD